MSFLNTLSPKNQINFSAIGTEINHKKSLFKQADRETLVQNIFVHGQAGTGKTMTILQLTKNWFKLLNIQKELESNEAYFLDFRDFCKFSLDQFRQDPVESQKARDMLKNLRSRNLLLIDDIGNANVTDRVKGEFETLIDARYQRAVQTFYTSNFSLDELQSIFGDRTVRRMKDNLRVIQIQGEDRTRLGKFLFFPSTKVETDFEKAKRMTQKEMIEKVMRGIESNNPTLARKIREGKEKQYDRIFLKLEQI